MQHWAVLPAIGMAFSIFDLYAQPPPQPRRIRGPYEFTKLPVRKLTGGSSDSFQLPETPPVPAPKPPVVSSVGVLGPYQTLTRKAFNGTLTVVRRKDFAPSRLPNPVRLPVYQAKARPRLRRQPARVHELLSYNYMENRHFWDVMNARKQKPNRKFVYRKSRSLQAQSFPIDSPKAHFHPRRSLTKSWLDPWRILQEAKRK